MNLQELARKYHKADKKAQKPQASRAERALATRRWRRLIKAAGSEQQAMYYLINC